MISKNIVRSKIKLKSRRFKKNKMWPILSPLNVPCEAARRKQNTTGREASVIATLVNRQSAVAEISELVLTIPIYQRL